jgi:hypothetical protein
LSHFVERNPFVFPCQAILAGILVCSAFADAPAQDGIERSYQPGRVRGAKETATESPGLVLRPQPFVPPFKVKICIQWGAFDR